MCEKILEEIKKYEKIIIHRHSNPDGDALGSQIGLCELIRATFPEKTVYKVGDGARRYSFMDGSTMDEIADGEYEGALAIILDTSAKALISDGRYTLAARTARATLSATTNDSRVTPLSSAFASSILSPLPRRIPTSLVLPP